MSSSYGKPRAAIGIEIPPCLCRVVMKRPATQPKMRRIKAINEYQMYCQSCGFYTHPDWCKQAVIAEWCGSNRPGDEHIENLWRQRHERQQQENTAIQKYL